MEKLPDRLLHWSLLGTHDKRLLMLEMQSEKPFKISMVTSPEAKRAFNIHEEPEAIRERYGYHQLGQCALLSRRLVEAGCRFVGVDHGSWDTHFDNFTSHSKLAPTADSAFSALVTDLDERGMLDETLVCFVTEFGRTPKINKAQGRDHWVNAYSIAFAGAGVPGGQVVGATDRHGGQVIESAYTPDDYAATIYKKIGLDLSQPIFTRENRPVLMTAEGRPIREVC